MIINDNKTYNILRMLYFIFFNLINMKCIFMQNLENINFIIYYLFCIVVFTILIKETLNCVPIIFYLTRHRNHIAIEIITRRHELTLIMNTSIIRRARREICFSNCFIYSISAGIFCVTSEESISARRNKIFLIH